MKEYYEFNSELELNKHLKYWSNACGELHHHGEYEFRRYFRITRRIAESL